MASREIDSRLTPFFVFDVQNITSNTTTLGGIALDTSGFESVEFIFFNTDDFTDGIYTFDVFDGDTNNAASHTLVSADLLTQFHPILADFNGPNQIFKQGYFGKKRFVSAQIISQAVTVGGRLGVVSVLDKVRRAPTPNNPF